MLSSAPGDPTDVIVLVVGVLGGVLVARELVLVALSGVARGSGALAHAASRTLVTLRPGIARRLAAAALGLSVPAAALVPSASATAAASAGASSARELTTAAPTGIRPVLAVASDPAAATHGATYSVRPGDTLWHIARRHLPAGSTDAQVARAWPRWYAANRGVIGPDPSLIVPGQLLLVPGRRSAGTPTQPHSAPVPGTPVPSAQSLDPDRR